MIPCSPNSWSLLIVRMLLATVLIGVPLDLVGKEQRAKLQVSGLGLLKNRTTKRILRELRPGEDSLEFYGANFVEDAALMLFNGLNADGYLRASVSATIVSTNDAVLDFVWKRPAEIVLPRPLQAREVRFEVERGLMYYYRTLEITGLEALPLKEGKDYFFRTDFLLPMKRFIRFSPQRLNSSVGNLTQALRQLGYHQARVTVAQAKQDEETGAVEVGIQVEQGRQYFVKTLKVRVLEADGAEPLSEQVVAMDEPYSEYWQQDKQQELAGEQYIWGFPDTRVKMNMIRQEEKGEQVAVAMEADVILGPWVELGNVRFQGYQRTRYSTLRRKVRLKGPALDRWAVDSGRERLARLGVFKQVEVRFEPAKGDERDVIYEVEEGKRYDVSLLFGYGSYDMLFGGAEFNHYNQFGLGHNTRIRAVQSMKSSMGNLTYTIPEFLARDFSLYTTADGLTREEITFTREEVILALGVRRSFPQHAVQVGLRYAYEFLNTQEAPAGVAEFSPTRAGAVILDTQLERRDNPLSPKKGTRVYASVELANPSLGGQSDYQRIELAGSYHQPLGGGRYLHLGLRYDIAVSPDPLFDLPFNKRFFPGGENSVRGYEQGGASPYNDQGQQIGAVSVLEWNIELEQKLTPLWSIVGFVDGAGTTTTLQDYPFQEVLWSAGGGIRWNTVVGPVRVEYGYNLTPRSFDPVGTFHFSVGDPF